MSAELAGTFVRGLNLSWQVGKSMYSHIVRSPLRDPRVRRWLEVTKAHHLDPLTALADIGAADVTPAVTTDVHELAKFLTPELLRKTAAMFNVRQDWLFARDDRAYEAMLLDRSYSPLVRELVAWKNTGTGHGILVFKSHSAELEDEPRQYGAMILIRTVGGSDEYPTYSYHPVTTLQSWAEPKQRWLALRAIWTAWQMDFAICGYVVSESTCRKLAEGTIFPGSIHRTWYAGDWHPDDYVVRPSPRAKGSNGHADTIEREHALELQATLATAGCTARRLAMLMQSNAA